MNGQKVCDWITFTFRWSKALGAGKGKNGGRQRDSDKQIDDILSKTWRGVKGYEINKWMKKENE